MKKTDKKPQGKKSKTNKPRRTTFSIGYLIVFLVVLYIIQMFMTPKANEISYSEFKEYLMGGNIVECSVGEKYIKGYLKGSSEDGNPVPFVTVAMNDPDLVSELGKHDINYKGEVENNFIKNMLIWWLFPFG